MNSVYILSMWTSPVFAEAQYSPNVEQALSILKTMCVTGGSSWNFEATGDGGLMLRKVGASASVKLNKKELEGFADAASKINAQQATEMRECMKPHINKIIGTVLSGGSSAGPAKIEIETKGYPFVTVEFDKIIAAAAADPSGVSITEIVKTTGYSATKVTHYLMIANDNHMGFLDNGSSALINHKFKVFQKGISYVISRGLIK